MATKIIITVRYDPFFQNSDTTEIYDDESGNPEMGDSYFAVIGQDAFATDAIPIPDFAFLPQC